MQNIKTFVIMSHKLTDEQIKDLNSEVILLSDVNPKLAQTVKNLNPYLSLKQIKEIALQCVMLASNKNCTQMVCMGEPCFAMWVNMFAGGLENGILFPILKTKLTCLQSTTLRESVDVVQNDGSIKKISVFKHVQWRNLFTLEE